MFDHYYCAKLTACIHVSKLWINFTFLDDKADIFKKAATAGTLRESRLDTIITIAHRKKLLIKLYRICVEAKLKLPVIIRKVQHSLVLRMSTNG